MKISSRHRISFLKFDLYYQSWSFQSDRSRLISSWISQMRQRHHLFFNPYFLKKIEITNFFSFHKSESVNSSALFLHQSYWPRLAVQLRLTPFLHQFSFTKFVILFFRALRPVCRARADKTRQDKIPRLIHLGYSNSIWQFTVSETVCVFSSKCTFYRNVNKINNLKVFFSWKNPKNQ